MQMYTTQLFALYNNAIQNGHMANQCVESRLSEPVPLFMTMQFVRTTGIHASTTREEIKNKTHPFWRGLKINHAHFVHAVFTPHNYSPLPTFLWEGCDNSPWSSRLPCSGRCSCPFSHCTHSISCRTCALYDNPTQYLVHSSKQTGKETGDSKEAGRSWTNNKLTRRWKQSFPTHVRSVNRDKNRVFTRMD